MIVNIPIKVKITGSSNGAGNDVIFHDLKIDDKGDLILNISVKGYQATEKFKKT